MLKLTYSRKKDRFQTVTVLGDAIGIRDLYWQLTHNYKAQDSTEIGSVVVTSLDGELIEAKDILSDAFAYDTSLSKNFETY
jgi:hypothetical protein